MAFSKSFVSSKDIFPVKVLDYFEKASRIRDGEEKLQAVYAGEGFIWVILEGSGYEQSKKDLDRIIERQPFQATVFAEDFIKKYVKEGVEREAFEALFPVCFKAFKPFTALNKANALLKLQQRELLNANIVDKDTEVYGQTGLVIVPERGDKEEMEKILTALEVEEDESSGKKE